VAGGSEDRPFVGSFRQEKKPQPMKAIDRRRLSLRYAQGRNQGANAGEIMAEAVAS